jgi:HD-GYP domain-containing protein (c-di-GMP phosphodiesterase class II)
MLAKQQIDLFARIIAAASFFKILIFDCGTVHAM